MPAFKLFDVVVVPFPFSDRLGKKRRPALVLCAETFQVANGHVVLAMITSAQNPSWNEDVTLAGLAATGLAKPSKVRMKLFTLDLRLVVRRIGELGVADQGAVTAALRRTFGWTR